MARSSRMIDISAKKETVRVARAQGLVVMLETTRCAIEEGRIEKGDVCKVAELAAIMAAKATPSIVPLCHPISLNSVEMTHQFEDETTLRLEVMVKSFGRTGVEMEALTAVSAACLTIYDMCKSIDREMVMTDIKLLSKDGGRSGSWRRDNN